MKDWKKCIVLDEQMMEILRIIERLSLEDIWLCAGTIRNFFWNGCVFDRETDVDVVFYDPLVSVERTKEIERQLQVDYPFYRWELKNQVYMHRRSPNTSPYVSSRDAISKFP